MATARRLNTRCMGVVQIFWRVFDLLHQPDQPTHPLGQTYSLPASSKIGIERQSQCTTRVGVYGWVSLGTSAVWLHRLFEWQAAVAGWDGRANAVPSMVWHATEVAVVKHGRWWTNTHISATRWDCRGSSPSLWYSVCLVVCAVAWCWYRVVTDCVLRCPAVSPLHMRCDYLRWLSACQMCSVWRRYCSFLFWCLALSFRKTQHSMVHMCTSRAKVSKPFDGCLSRSNV